MTSVVVFAARITDGERRAGASCIHEEPHRHVQWQCAQDRPVRRQLLVGPLRHQGAGALVGDLAGMSGAGAARRRGRPRFHAADRALEGLRRRDRFSWLHAGDHHLGGRTARRHQAHDRVRHRACAAVPSVDRRQGVRHRRPHRRGPHGHEHRLRLERGRIRHVRRQAARARRALRIRAGMGRRRQSRPGRATILSTSTASFCI